jgi:hypothetical protein
MALRFCSLSLRSIPYAHNDAQVNGTGRVRGFMPSQPPNKVGISKHCEAGDAQAHTLSVIGMMSGLGFLPL